GATTSLRIDFVVFKMVAVSSKSKAAAGKPTARTPDGNDPYGCKVFACPVPETHADRMSLCWWIRSTIRGGKTVGPG
ncbi:MAG TPA: hypothetical protein PK177_15975, partial [Burkholderiaceae bacterium]|nr:hypothetical protein [Burkholderiaceae bacterium]